MDEFDDLKSSSQSEGHGDVADDFEKVDSLISEPVSSTTKELEEAEPEDLYTGSHTATSEADVATGDLLGSFSESPKKTPAQPKIDPFFEPESSAYSSPEPSAPSPPAPVKTEESDKSSSCAGICPAASCCQFFKNMDPRVLDLIYWRDIKKSGIVFGSMMVTLISLATFSVLSVMAYLSLVVLTVTLSFSIYKKVLQAVQKTGDGHPFKEYLEKDLSLPSDKVHQVVDTIMEHANKTGKEVRRLFLVEDLVDSLKFGLLLWVFTYIGSWFNGITIIILAVVSLFTFPKVYEMHKTQIDNYLDLAMKQIKNVWAQVQSKIPLKKKTQ
ncbi:reticulon-1-A-like [Tubulanus polymorphus]|uniref:reticulon-1-A-like n=1 Tax=Tubulanus polymorphus TaxID=672921 RepID=UPI003DA57B10